MRPPLFWAFTALAVSPVFGAVSRTGRCGASYNGLNCQGSTYGNCCSQYDFCGATKDHCGTGCQSGFGTCTSASPPSTAPKVSNDGSCGGAKGFTCKGSPFGNCCSQYGWCGSSSAYCGTGCNPQQGTCSGSLSSSTRVPSTLSTRTSTSSTRTSPRTSTSTSTRTSTSSSTRTSTSAAPSSTQKVTTNARCGNSFGAAPKGMTCAGSKWGNCCSDQSYCGSTEAYCGKGCQSEYGKCDPPAVSSSTESQSSTSSSLAPATTSSSSSSTALPSSSSTSEADSAITTSSSQSATSSDPTSSSTSDTVSSSATSTTSSSAAPTVTATCGFLGAKLLTAPVVGRGLILVNSAPEREASSCKSYCLTSVPGCVSFSLRQSKCQFFAAPVAEVVYTGTGEASTESDFKFYDIMCNVYPSTSSPAPTSTATTGAEAPSITCGFTGAVIQNQVGTYLPYGGPVEDQISFCKTNCGKLPGCVSFATVIRACHFFALPVAQVAYTGTGEASSWAEYKLYDMSCDPTGTTSSSSVASTSTEMSSSSTVEPSSSTVETSTGSTSTQSSTSTPTTPSAICGTIGMFAERYLEDPFALTGTTASKVAQCRSACETFPGCLSYAFDDICMLFGYPVSQVLARQDRPEAEAYTFYDLSCEISTGSSSSSSVVPTSTTTSTSASSTSAPAAPTASLICGQNGLTPLATTRTPMGGGYFPNNAACGLTCASIACSYWIFSSRDLEAAGTCNLFSTSVEQDGGFQSLPGSIVWTSENGCQPAPPEPISSSLPASSTSSSSTSSVPAAPTASICAYRGLPPLSRERAFMPGSEVKPNNAACGTACADQSCSYWVFHNDLESEGMCYLYSTSIEEDGGIEISLNNPIYVSQNGCQEEPPNSSSSTSSVVSTTSSSTAAPAPTSSLLCGVKGRPRHDANMFVDFLPGTGSDFSVEGCNIRCAEDNTCKYVIFSAYTGSINDQGDCYMYGRSLQEDGGLFPLPEGYFYLSEKGCGQAPAVSSSSSSAPTSTSTSSSTSAPTASTPTLVCGVEGTGRDNTNFALAQGTFTLDISECQILCAQDDSCNYTVFDDDLGLCYLMPRTLEQDGGLSPLPGRGILLSEKGCGAAPAVSSSSSSVPSWTSASSSATSTSTSAPAVPTPSLICEVQGTSQRDLAMNTLPVSGMVASRSACRVLCDSLSPCKYSIFMPHLVNIELPGMCYLYSTSLEQDGGLLPRPGQNFFLSEKGCPYALSL